MPRYSLRTLILIVLLAGPLLALGFGYAERIVEELQAEDKAPAQAQPSYYYISDGSGYYPSGPEFVLSNEEAAMEARRADRGE